MYIATIYYLDKDGQPSIMQGSFKSELEAISAVGLVELTMEHEKNPDTFLGQKIEKVGG